MKVTDIFNNNIDPKKTNLDSGGLDQKIKDTAGRIQENEEQLNKSMVADELDQREADSLGADPFVASMSAEQLANRQRDAAYSDYGQRAEGTPYGGSPEDLDRSFLSEFGTSITRGIGDQVISGTGDMVNFFASAAPWWTMDEGTALGNFLNDVGGDIADANTTYVSKLVKEQDVTWGSLANPEFWSVHIAETIPLMLEFVAAGKGFASLGTRGAMKLANVAGKSGRLSKGAGKMAYDFDKAAKFGTKEYYKLSGTGSRFVRPFLQEAGGVIEATQGFKNMAGVVTAGISQNLMAGAMNGMQVHKEMKAENERNMEEFGFPLYTEEQMSRAAAGTFTRNMEYVGVDILSWGYTFGGARGVVGKKLGQSVTKPVREMLGKSTQLFGARMKPIADGIGKYAVRAGAKIIPEGIEESFQETFEEWAGLRSRAKWGGTEPAPGFLEFYMSDENRATRIISAVSGGFMGGAFNMKSIINGHADEQFDAYDRGKMLKTSVESLEGFGRHAKEFAIDGLVFDVVSQGKEDLFEVVLNDMYQKGQISDEQMIEAREDFEQTRKDFEAAESLNLKGKSQLALYSRQKRSYDKVMTKLASERDAEIADAIEGYSDPESIKLITEQITEKYDQQITSLAFASMQADVNRKALLSGKRADPLAIKFAMSADGKEHILTPEMIQSEEDFERVMENPAFLISGLTDEEYQEYVSKSDEQIFEEAKAANQKMAKGLNAEKKSLWESIKSKFVKDENAESNSPTESSEETQAEAVIKEMTDEESTAFFEEKVEENMKSGMTREEAIKKATEQLEQEKKDIQEAIEQQKEAKKKEEEEKEEGEKEEEKEKEAKGKTSDDENVEDQDEYVKSQLAKTEAEVEAESKGSVTLEEERKAREEQAKKDFLEEQENEEDDTDTDVGWEMKPTGKGKGVTVSYNGDDVVDKNGKLRKFLNPTLAQKFIDSQSSKPKGPSPKNPKSKKSGKAMKAPVMSSQETQVVMAQMRRATIAKAAYSQSAYGMKSQQNSTNLPFTQNDLDRYISSTRSMWKYGPTVIQKQRAINYSLKAKGINADVVAVDNLFETVGEESVGYTLLNTIFIDENSWEQPEVLMHEMVHVLYPMFKDTPVGKRVIEFAYENKELVKFVKEAYAEHVNYDFTINGIEYSDSLMNITEQLSNVTGIPADMLEHQAINNPEEFAKYFESFKESPIEDQEYINEELTAFTLQGPLSTRLNEYFEPKKETKRIEVSTSYWASLKGKTEVEKDAFDSLAQALNDGKPVAREDLFDFISEGFAKSKEGKPKNFFTTQGRAMRLKKSKADYAKRIKEINDEKENVFKNIDTNEFVKKFQKSFYDQMIDKINKEYEAKDGATDEEIDRLSYEKQLALEKYEEDIMDSSSYDDSDAVSIQRVRGASRTLNSFIRSYNYVKRQRHLRSGKPAGSLNSNMLLDRDALYTQFYNMANETKGDSAAFIDAVKNSSIVEVSQFYKYLDKVSPEAKTQILHDMAYTMSNYRVISSIKTFSGNNNAFVMENALNERERHLVENRMRQMKSMATEYKNKTLNQQDSIVYENFLEAMKRIRNKATATQQDYLTVMEMFAFPGLDMGAILNENMINWKGQNFTIKRVINNLARRTNAKGEYANFYKEDGNFNFGADSRMLLEALADTNRKNTARTTVLNAEGNQIATRITNNNLIVRTDKMVEFLTKGKRPPTFQQFKKEFGSIIPYSRRNIENTILRSIYDNVTKGKSIPSISQYVGNVNQVSDKNSLFKDSDSITQNIEEFLMFESGKRSGNYKQSMGAFADSPRKFLYDAPLLAYDKMFLTDGNFSSEGKKAMNSAYEIYKGLEKNTKEKDLQIKSQEQFNKDFQEQVKKEIEFYNKQNPQLANNPAMKSYYTNGKLNEKGIKAVTEFEMNRMVNGLSLAEIFTPGISVNNFGKRNKLNSAPVQSMGNPNFKINFIYINDGSTQLSTDGGMYINTEGAKRITNNGRVLSNFGNAVKILNHHIESENPNMRGNSVSMKGYTNVISDDTLKSEPGLTALNEMMWEVEGFLNQELFGKEGKYPGEDLLNGETNFITVAVPTSAIKSNIFSDEQKAKYDVLTFENLEKAYNQKENGDRKLWDEYVALYKEMNADANGNFVGLSSENFGPQQVMDKLTVQSTTPVQFISSVITMESNNHTQLQAAEEIQRLVRMDMVNNLDQMLKELGTLSPSEYKDFILKRLDMEQMDQAQKMLLVQDITNLDHTRIGEFVNNTLANSLKYGGNKLKTNGAISQQKPSLHYRNENGYYTMGADGPTNKIKGYSDHSVRNGTGSAPLEIVLPKSHSNKVKKRKYITHDGPEILLLLEQKMYSGLKREYHKHKANGDKKGMLEVTKQVAIEEALAVNNTHGNLDSFGSKSTDFIGEFFDSNGQLLGYFARGEMVMATRIPSNGPSFTGVFETIDFLSGEENGTIVSEEFTGVVGADYDGDQLFIQSKGKDTPNFNKALDLTMQLYTSPDMYNLIREKLDIETVANELIKNRKNKIDGSNAFPFSGEFNRNGYEDTMIAKRSIGQAFNLHRLMGYLASYDVKISKPITINGNEKKGFTNENVKGMSRVLRSGIIANMILDNSKEQFTNKLGINDKTLNSVMMLVNMNFDMQDVVDIMTSKPVQEWTRLSKKNDSPYMQSKRPTQLKEEVLRSLGISNVKPSGNYSIDTSKISTDPNQMRDVIELLSYLETINSEAMKVSKIMAGHKGIEVNPLILEKQLKDFNEVMDNKSFKQTLEFNKAFANNPDIAAYKSTAEKVLETMKEVDRTYSNSVSSIMATLDDKLSLFGMTEPQLKRASNLVLDFYNSRVLGLNNISKQEKLQRKEQLFKDLDSYFRAMYSNGLLGNSILFSKALNVSFGTYSMSGAMITQPYISANPTFFDQSLTEEDYKTAQREFEELPKEIKENMIVYDLMENNLSGPKSLTNVFDELTDLAISDNAYQQRIGKDKKLSTGIERMLMSAIVANEFKSPDSSIPKAFTNGQKISANNLNTIFNDGILARFNMTPKSGSSGFYLSIDGKPHYFSGFTAEEMNVYSRIRNKGERRQVIANQITERINPVKIMDGDLKDISLSAKSIKDSSTDGLRYSPPQSNNYDGRADYIIETNIAYEERKKKVVGKAYKKDYHNFSDQSEITRQEFDTAMEFNNSVSESQRQALYEVYKVHKKEANELASKVNWNTVGNMSYDKLMSYYEEFAKKDMYAYSIVSTPLIIEMSNRLSADQTKITGASFEGKDITLIQSFFDNNNIPSNNPALQGLVRTINNEYKTFAKERSSYIKKINSTTEALYKDKFDLSDNKIVRGFQKVYNSLLKDRGSVYEKLYGNITETEVVKLPNKKTTTNFKLKTREQIEKMKSQGMISPAEYDFYNMFTGITSEFEKFSGASKTRKGYIPHTSMGNLEMYSSRGLLGLLVNSKEGDSSADDVKMWSNVRGRKELLTFKEIKDEYNAKALSSKNDFREILEFRKMRKKANELLKKGENEDGTTISFSNIQNMTMADMAPMSRFSKSRSVRAEIMPSMDLNKALVDYVHTTLFTKGNDKFQGFEKLMPVIDGVFAFNDKKGLKNSSNYVKEVLKEKFIMREDQNLFGKKGDKIVNGLVKGNLLYALGYKGLIVGKGIYAVGNIAIGKYMNIKREGGKTWAKGESRYWGVDEGFGIEALERRERAKNILNNLGFMELSMYDDVSITKQSGLDGILTRLALLPMSISEDWIQKAHFLGMMTEEEFNKFDEKGNYKEGEVPIPQTRILELEERVKLSHGKGYTPTDQSRIHTYSLGRMFMQFSRHIPANIRERFAKEDVNIYGQKHIGSLRQFYATASAVISGQMGPAEFKEYWESLEPHQKEAFSSALRGMAMVTIAGFVDASLEDSSNGLSPDNIARGLNSDANIYADLDRMLYKTTPPAFHSTQQIIRSFMGGQ